MQVIEDYVNKEDVDLIRECIERLSDEQKTVMLAYYYDNLKVSHISEILSISEGAVKSRLYLARRDLQGHIEAEEKKRVYKLQSFGALALVSALRRILQTNMELGTRVEETIFSYLCKELKFDIG